jgi:hypothetical protein
MAANRGKKNPTYVGRHHRAERKDDGDKAKGGGAWHRQVDIEDPEKHQKQMSDGSSVV